MLGRFVLSDVPFHTLTGARLLLGLPLLGVIVAAQGSLGEVQTGLAADPGRLVLLALVPGLLGLLLYYRGLAGTRASLAALAEFAFPATAVALNWVILGVGVSANQVVGFFLLWGSVLVLGYLNSRTPAPEPRLATAGARQGN